MYIFTSIILCIISALCHSAAFGTGTINPRPCTEGYYCTGATVTASPCPSGSFSNRTGLTQASECILCTPGSTCTASGLTAPGKIFGVALTITRWCLWRGILLWEWSKKWVRCEWNTWWYWRCMSNWQLLSCRFFSTNSMPIVNS
jgi:hypothetical protein